MRGIDELRTSAPARALAHGRLTAGCLATRGWSVSQSLTDPRVDVAARRRWSRRSGIHATVHLLVQIDTSAERHLLFDAAPPAVRDDVLPFWWMGEHPRELAPILDSDQRAAVQRLAFPRGESRIARAIAPAPPSSLVASAWRDADGADHASVEAAFASAADAAAALLRHDLDVLRDDAELGVVDPVELVAPMLDELHHFVPVVVTDASMWAADKDLAPIARVRVARRSLAGREHSWIDVVHVSAIDAYFDAVTAHFASFYARRRFAATQHQA